MKDKIIKMLSSKSPEDIRLGIEFLLGMGFNKANSIVKELHETRFKDGWRNLRTSTPFWGYYNSTRSTFRIIVSHDEILVIYNTEEYVRDKLGWKNLDI